MKTKKYKRALIVEGGGMRGVFSAGVLNAFGKEEFDPFDLYIGVSAGACNLASHLAGQNSRNYDIIMRWSSTGRFINPWRLFTMGNIMDLDWLWDITIRNYRLRLDVIMDHLKSKGKTFAIVATSMETGMALYLQPSYETLEDLLKVSSSVPILYRGKLLAAGQLATDGGVADPIPVGEALRMGVKEITVIRSRPSGYIEMKGPEKILHLLFRKYPEFQKSLKKRTDQYMKSVQLIHNPPEGATIHEIAPPVELAISRLTRNKIVLEQAYRTGIEYGLKYIQRSDLVQHEEKKTIS